MKQDDKVIAWSCGSALVASMVAGLCMSSYELHAQPQYSNRLNLELQSLLVGAGNGIPTQLVLNSGGAILVLTLPSVNNVQNPGVDWSDPFDAQSVWTVQRAGVTYAVTGDKLLGLIMANGKPGADCVGCVR